MNMNPYEYGNLFLSVRAKSRTGVNSRGTLLDYARRDRYLISLNTNSTKK